MTLREYHVPIVVLVCVIGLVVFMFWALCADQKNAELDVTAPDRCRFMLIDLEPGDRAYCPHKLHKPKVMVTGSSKSIVCECPQAEVDLR